MSLRCYEHVKDVAKLRGYKGLPIRCSRFPLIYQKREICGSDQLAKSTITPVNLGYPERPLRIIGHFPSVCRIKQKRNWRVRRAAVRMSFRESNELVCDAPDGI